MFTWRHGGHVGGVKYSFGNWTLFLCNFIMQIWLLVTWVNTLYSSGANINYLFRFLTDVVQQSQTTIWNTALKVWRRLQRIYTENTKFSIGLRIYYSGLRLYSSGTRTSYSFASSWFINMRNRTVAWFSRLTAKLFQENFPMKSSSRFCYCSDCSLYDGQWNHPIIIHCSSSVYLQKIVRSKLHFVIPNQ